MQLFATGEYDVVSASGDASLRLVYGDRVQPVNTALVPNYADIFPDLKDKPWNSVNGVSYGIPHGRGANLLLYNKAANPTPPTSWKDMWDANSPAKGKISPYDDAIYIADAAVYLMATQPDLGIKNPYALDQKQFDAATTLLKQQKPLVAEYWGDYVKQGQGLASGSIAQGQGWQLTANLANADGDKVGTTKPKEGATGWSDTWMVKKDTANINCSYQWLNYIVSPQVNAQIAEYFGEAPRTRSRARSPTNKDHCAQFHAEETGFWSDVYYWTTPTANCLDGRTDTKCVRLRRLGEGLEPAAQQLIHPLPPRPRPGGLIPSVRPGRTYGGRLQRPRDQHHWHPRRVTTVEPGMPPACRRCCTGGPRCGWPACSRPRCCGSACSTSCRWAFLLATAFFATDSFTGRVLYTFTTENVVEVLTNPAYLLTAVRTVGVAVGVTVLCVVLAVPLAAYMALVPARARGRCSSRSW